MRGISKRLQIVSKLHEFLSIPKPNQFPAVVNETVKAVRDYINGEFKKYNAWEEFRAIKINSSLFQNEGNFQQSKQKGVGSGIITKFLNGGEKKGNWNQSMIAKITINFNSERDFLFYY